jgi:uncharacterized membrane protein YdjX (TVP38/TMEM64 family)
MKPWTFFIFTFIGIAPGTFVYVNLGRRLGDVSEIGDLLSTKVVLALTMLGLLALTPVIYRRWAARRSAHSSKE